jgi:hypothetical protein
VTRLDGTGVDPQPAGSGPEADVEGAIDADFTHFPRIIHINPKFFKIQPSPADPKQRGSKKKAWISLDSLVDIGLDVPNLGI